MIENTKYLSKIISKPSVKNNRNNEVNEVYRCVLHAVIEVVLFFESGENEVVCQRIKTVKKLNIIN
jgi:hypothetical protein